MSSQGILTLVVLAFTSHWHPGKDSIPSQPPECCSSRVPFAPEMQALKKQHLPCKDRVRFLSFPEENLMCISNNTYMYI